MSADLLLTLNAGSSTVKIGLFEANDTSPRLLARGTIDFRMVPACLRFTGGTVKFQVNLNPDPSKTPDIMAETFGWLAKHFDLNRVTVVGHRVVHGGNSFAGPVRIDDPTIEALDKLTILAPLHCRSVYV